MAGAELNRLDFVAELKAFVHEVLKQLLFNPHGKEQAPSSSILELFRKTAVAEIFSQQHLSHHLAFATLPRLAGPTLRLLLLFVLMN